MPYLQASWIQALRTAKGEVQTSASATLLGKRALRTVPHDQAHKGGPNSGEVAPVGTPSPSDLTRIQCISNIVKSQVEELHALVPSLTTEDETFYRYALQVDMVVFAGKYSNIYLAHHQDHLEHALVARVYEPASKIDAQRSMFLKILKHLGKRHPSLIGTWDIFFDSAGRVVIFQELALHGNMSEYIKQNNVFVPEAQMADWARQIYRGMDFLGDCGIAHRAINPKHILLSPDTSGGEHDRTLAKLASFRDAIVYYDPKSGTVRNQPCKSLDKRPDSPYHAPEVFGDPPTEEYDPIVADVWSYGATFFVASSRVYPCRYKCPYADYSAEIQKQISNATNLSAEAKRWFSGLLRGDASRRTSFDQIATDPWFMSFNQQQN